MFKKNYDHLPKDTYFGLYKEATRGNPNYFLTYGNGKSAARIRDFLRPNGAHRWHNYMKTPKYDILLYKMMFYYGFYWNYFVYLENFMTLLLFVVRLNWRRLQFYITLMQSSQI